MSILTHRCCSDKTQVFHDQIEAKQRELQPWTAKMNDKQAEVDVAVSERDTLAKKAETLLNARKAAQEALTALQLDHSGKVRLIVSMTRTELIDVCFIAGKRSARAAQD